MPVLAIGSRYRPTLAYRGTTRAMAASTGAALASDAMADTAGDRSDPIAAAPRPTAATRVKAIEHPGRSRSSSSRCSWCVNLGIVLLNNSDTDTGGSRTRLPATVESVAREPASSIAARSTPSPSTSTTASPACCS